MSEQWAERIRHTNRLVRAVAGHFLRRHDVSAAQLYGLCKLTWITSSYSSENARYIKSTKIPALADSFERPDFLRMTLEEVASEVASEMRSSQVAHFVLQHTGFTHFYKAYRNSAKDWLEAHSAAALPLFRSAFRMTSDREGLAIVKRMENMPGIPKPKNSRIKMQAQHLLTPAFASLDRRLRFPLINGNEGVVSVLKALGVRGAPLPAQYTAMITLYGRHGIRDAADLDQIGRDLPDFLQEHATNSAGDLLQSKAVTGRDLPVKDDADTESVLGARRLKQRHLHNSMTNQLRNLCSEYTLLEGSARLAMYDVLIARYNGRNEDLLVEVKSSFEDGNIRMAIGQLYAYRQHLQHDRALRLSVLLPEKPPERIERLLGSLGTGLMWLTDETLSTSTTWLRRFVKSVMCSAESLE